jgi:SAM-dependent methyltransferase
MTETNKKTLASYDQHVPEYVTGTSNVVSGATKSWIDAALNGLPRDATLLELGSGHGRDALYIQQQGYEVACTDATPAFVEHLRGLGLQASHFNALTDIVASKFDLIFANAVLLHFTREEFVMVLAKMAGALKPDGRFAFSLKRGNAEEWSNAKLNAPRYFCYWEPEALPVLLSRAGFSSWSIDAVTTERTHPDWICVIAWRSLSQPTDFRCN